MTTLTRWNPFKVATRFDPMSGFEDLLRGLGTRPQWQGLETAPQMRVDVSEDDKAFHVKAEIPGVDKDDVEISINGNQLTITAETKREITSKEDETDVYSERYFGKTYRSFTLPGDVDSAKAKARSDNGVLTLSLPKKANGSTRRIAVS